MLKNFSTNRSVKSISAILSASAFVMGMGLSTPVQASEPFLGQIDTFGFGFAPRNWAFCDGQLLSISSNTALFSLLGTTYGGDGRTTFGLPDLRGRSAVHPGTGPGLSPVSWGQRGGAQSHTLTVAQMPAHSHAATATLHGTDTAGDTPTPGDNILASKSRTNIYSTNPPDVDLNAASVTVTVGNNGSGQAFDIRDPFVGIYHSISLAGIYPSRS